MGSTYRLEKGSTVLVTGATGLVGSAIADELLRRGFKVLAATRDLSKAGPLEDKLTKLYGPRLFKPVELKDISSKASWLAAIQGVSGIIHTATDNSMSLDTDRVVAQTKQTHLSMLEAAAETPSVLSVVSTSTRVTVYAAEYGQDKEYSLDTFADFFLPMAQSASDEDPVKGVYVYAAAKTEAEKAAWSYYKEQNPSFAFNVVIPDWVLGPVVNPAPGNYSSVSVTKAFFNGDPTSPLPLLANPAGYVNDVRDVAILHVAALLDKEVSGERLWAMGHQIHINDLLKIWREAFPDKAETIPKHLDYPPPNRQIIDRSKSEILLQRFAGRSWYPLKDSVIDTVILNPHLNASTDWIKKA